MTEEELKTRLEGCSKEQLVEMTANYFNMVNLSPNEARELNKCIGDLESEVSDLEGQVQNLEGHLDYYGHFDQMKERIDELESDKDTLQSRVDDLESELDEKVEMSARVDELETELSEYSDYYELQSRVDELEAELSEYSDYYDLSIRVDELEAEAENAEELRNQLSDLQDEIDSMRAGQIYGDSYEGSGTIYIGSLKKNIFHRPSCKWTEYLTPSNSIEFSDHEEAVAAGYKPCKTCCA